MSEAARHEPSSEAIESPCVGVCAIDNASGLCRGCLRTLEEIAAWRTYSPAQRREVIAALSGRVLAHAGDEAGAGG